MNFCRLISEKGREDICKAKPGQGHFWQCQISSSHGHVHVRHRQQVPHKTVCLRLASCSLKYYAGLIGGEIESASTQGETILRLG